MIRTKVAFRSKEDLSRPRRRMGVGNSHHLGARGAREIVLSRKCPAVVGTRSFGECVEVEDVEVLLMSNRAHKRSRRNGSQDHIR